MSTPAMATRRRPLLPCAFVTLTALMCGGLLCATALVSAPPVVSRLLVVCIGCPMAAAASCPPRSRTYAAPARALDSRSLEALRRQLDALPETQHPP
jgi:hypothetical protein